jgi:hypothetical protein
MNQRTFGPGINWYFCFFSTAETINPMHRLRTPEDSPERS